VSPSAARLDVAQGGCELEAEAHDLDQRGRRVGDLAQQLG
jgi:hypothetical protein